MSATAIWETQASEQLEITAPTDESSESATARNSIAALQELVLRLLSEVQCINETSPLSIDSGFDFYDEVSRFEVDLIKRALLQTGGHHDAKRSLPRYRLGTSTSWCSTAVSIPPSSIVRCPVIARRDFPNMSARFMR